MKIWITTLLLSIFVSTISADPYKCSPPAKPPNGKVACPSGTDHFTMCVIECDDGYEISGPSRLMCWCRTHDECSWKGGSTMCQPIQCEMPFFDSGRVLLADKWPGGFAGIIEFDRIKGNLKTLRGWSVVLVFDRQLGKKVSLTSWTTELSASSFYGQTFTLVNVDHNHDLQKTLKTDPNFKILFIVNDLEGAMPTAAYVGLYNNRIQDASCVLAPRMHQIKPATSLQLPTATNTKKTKVMPSKVPKTENKSKAVKRPRRPGAKNRRRKKVSVVKSAMSTTTVPPRPIVRTFPTTTTRLTTTTVPPTTATTKLTATTIFTTTTTLPTKGRYCVIQRGSEAYTSEKPWTDRGIQSFHANAKLTSSKELEDWSMVIVFGVSIKNIQVWSAQVVDSSSDGIIWNFGPLKWEKGMRAGDKNIDFIATTREFAVGIITGQVFLCSDSFTDGDAVMMRPQGTSSKAGGGPRSRSKRDTQGNSDQNPKTNNSPSNERKSGTGARCGKGSKTGISVKAAAQTALNFTTNKDRTKYNYNELLHKSILFFEAQRSGLLPPEQRVLWRGNSGLKDGCDLKVDATGGWYDAGNFVKYNFPMAFSLTTLAWSGIAFRDAYQDAGEMENFINLIKWPTRYLIKCHVSKYEFIAQVGNSKFDDSYWGRPEEMNIRRPTYKITAKKPGTELAAEAAAALAASSIFLKESDPKLSATALKHAKELYEFADKYRGKYHLAVPAAAPQYQSYSGYDDELIWAATWLHKATNDIKYLKAAGTLYTKIKGRWSVEDRYVWDRKLVGAQALLAEITGNDIYREPLAKFLDNLETATTNSKGMYFLDKWGPNRYTRAPLLHQMEIYSDFHPVKEWKFVNKMYVLLNEKQWCGGSAFIALIAGTLTPYFPRENSYFKWAKDQMGMVLGDKGRSYVVGFGKNYPKYSRHSASSCPPYPQKCDWSTFNGKKPNHYILYGGLVGGPDEDGVFDDDRANVEGNHVACDYNAVFQSAIAGLKHFALKNKGLEEASSTSTHSSKESLATSPTSIPSSSQAVVTGPTQFANTTSKGTMFTTTKEPEMTRPMISEKVRCARHSPVGKAVRNAKQITPNFKANNAQRAGRLPLDNRVPWRGDSTLKDGCDVGVDVSGGWFDAGDHVKFGFPMAFTLTTLAWGGIAFRDAYEDSGELQHMIKTVKWGANYFVKAHTAKYELIGQVGNGNIDHDSWGRPETMSMRRPTYKITAKKPGTELAAETAAGLAASSIFLKKTDPKFSEELIRHAEELYEFADKYRGLYHKSIKDAKEFYKSYSGYDDELIWGAAWLYKATNKNKYLQKANEHYNRIGGKYVVETRYSWDRKLCGAQAILGDITGRSDFKDPFFKMIDGLMRARTTPQGMHFLTKWGSNRYAAGAAFMASIAAKMNAPRKAAYKKWARKQIDLMLGDSGRSYVIGYGKNYPKRPHHRASSCPPYPKRCDWQTFHSQAPNHYILYGALVGGPDEKGRYLDKRDQYEQTEVTTDYNACFQSAVAGVKHFVMKNRGSKQPTVKPATNRGRTPKPSRYPGTTKPSRKPGTTRKPQSKRPGKGAAKKPGANRKMPCRPPTSFRCRRLARLAQQRRNRSKRPNAQNARGQQNNKNLPSKKPTQNQNQQKEQQNKDKNEQSALNQTQQSVNVTIPELTTSLPL